MTGVVGLLCLATGLCTISGAEFTADCEPGTGDIGDDKGEIDPIACGRLSG